MSGRDGEGPGDGEGGETDGGAEVVQLTDRRPVDPLPPPIPLFPTRSDREGEEDNLVMLPGLRADDEEEVKAVVQEDGTLAPPPEHLVPAAVEALLLAAEAPVTVDQLDRWLGNPGPAKVRAALHAWARRQNAEHGGIRLVQVAKGWQLRTDVRFAPWVAAMRGGRPLRLSRAALDTLSILAYRQPATRGEIEELRGVESGGVLRMLCERGLAMVVGRKEVPGRPLLYGTTRGFLSLFNLRDLSDLPTLRDLRELYGDRLPDEAELGPDPLENEDASGADEEEEAATDAPASVELPADEGAPDDDGDEPEPPSEPQGGRGRKHLGLVRKAPPGR
ncbi:MAG: SMC-Scp complex subunit ScpB [Deltaproteobacteria bacterium]|nr:SMC-Scp complex subunit ScpB [Deltaproteobacteria bacterium]